MTTETSNNKNYTEMCYKTREQGAGQLVYEDLSRRIRKTNKKYVGFEIDGRIPPWESLRKNRLLLRYDVRSILNFANYSRKKAKRAEGVIKYKHKYTVAQQLIFWKVLFKLAAAKLIENRCQVTLPYIGKLKLIKTNQKGTYYDKEEGKHKVHLNLHTLRKFITIRCVKSPLLKAPSVVFKKSNFMRLGIFLFYKKKENLYANTLQKIKEKYNVYKN